MRRLFAVIIAVCLLVAPAAFAETLPTIDKGAISIPWNDFKEILEKLQAPGPAVPEPPVDYAIGRGRLSGRLADERLEIDAEYPVSVLKNGWVLVPLVNPGSPIAEILVDGKQAAVTNETGQVSLVLRGPADHTLRLRFSAPASMRPGPGTASLQLPRAAGHVLELRAGDKLAGITVDGATMSERPDKTHVAVLTNDYLTVRYTVALEQAEAVEKKLPPKVLVDIDTLVSVDEGFIRAVAQLAFEVRHAPVTEFAVRLPEGFEVADCSGASLIGWKVDGERVLRAQVGFEVKGAYALTVVLEKSTKDESFEFALPAIAARDVERDRGHFAVQVTGGVEVSAEKIEGLQPVDAKELPPGLRGGATNPIVLSFKYLRHPFDGRLRVVRHKTQPVLSAAIDAANYVVQVTDDGDGVTQAIYTVRNNRKQFLEVLLPAGDKTALWSSFVGGKPVKPSKTAEGKILLPLEKSGYAGEDLSSFKVEIIYYSTLGGSLQPAGAFGIALPEVDLPVSQSALTVYAPPKFRYKRLGGSMSEAYAAAAPGFLGGLAGPMGAAAPMEEKAAEARDMEDLIDAPMAKSAMRQQTEAEQVFQQRLRAAQSSTDSYGALPARFAIPKAGSGLAFSEYITIGEASTLRLGYARRGLIDLLNLLPFLLTAALAWYARRLLGAGTMGTRAFFAAAALIVALAFAGLSVGMIVAGAVVGLGARFVLWTVTQIRLQRTMAKAG